MAQRKNDSGTSRALKRYGPLAVVIVLVIGAIALLGGGGDDDDNGEETSTQGTEGTGGDEGADSGLPLTFQEAEDAGEDIDFGPGCNTDTGRVNAPLRNAAPCIEPWEEGADNGGATAEGVTADSIKIVVYQGQPDPLQQALVGAAGADTDPDAVSVTAVDYLEMFDEIYETYGRKLDVEVVKGTGGPADATAAQADARTVIDKKPSAVVGGPGQTPAFWQELANAGIMCLGTCVQNEGWDIIEENAPLLWPTGLTPEQADLHLAEMLGKQLVGKNAEFAGDEAMKDQPRVFGWVQAETETGEYAARNDEFERIFAEEYGGEIATRSTYIFDPGAAQETATTVIARMRDAGVTTVILSVDPLIPKNITEEATKQGYFPEWVVGPSVLADTTIFGRTFDQQQWRNAIGLSLPPARGAVELSDSYGVYEWYYGTEPPTNTHGVILPGTERLALGIHLAGPELTPETFRDGMFNRWVPRSSGKTFTHQSWGEELWGRADYNSADDAAVFWWNPEATGEDETGNEGTGMLAWIDGGTRYLPGEWPEDPLPFFEDEGSVTFYDELPEGESFPDIEPWPGSPAAG